MRQMTEQISTSDACPINSSTLYGRKVAQIWNQYQNTFRRLGRRLQENEQNLGSRMESWLKGRPFVDYIEDNAIPLERKMKKWGAEPTDEEYGCITNAVDDLGRIAKVDIAPLLYCTEKGRNLSTTTTLDEALLALLP